jgi:sulfur-oxidizing protein SoxZ
MRIKAKSKGGITTVKVMAKHAMLSYQEAEKKKVDVNFITHVIAKLGDEVVYEVSTSQFLSKNPYMQFVFNAEAAGAKKGDKVEVNWVDNTGKTKKGGKKIK